MREEEADRESDPPSKSERKRHMHALQELGEMLVQLSDRQLATIPIEDARLAETIREARAIHSKSARRRHLQLIGKLMRDVDPEPIENALAGLYQQQNQESDAFHLVEELRDEILSRGPPAIELTLQRWPKADRQQLRQLMLQHQRETERGKPLAASRKLFRYLRDLQENYGDS